MSFKDDHDELQQLVLEHGFLQRWNKDHEKQTGPGRPPIFLFAEGALIFVILERFLRIILGDRATEQDTLYNLLQRATSRKAEWWILLPWDDQEEGIKKVVGVRNSIQHANYEQAAKAAGMESRHDYFRKQFAGEIDMIHKIVDCLMRQIDHETGLPFELASSPPSISR